MFYFRDNRFHNSCAMNVFFGWKICQCYRFLLFSSLQMSRRLTYWLSHIFISRYIYSCHSHSEHLQFSFFSSFSDFLYNPFIESRSSFVKCFSTINPMTANCKLNDIILDCSRFCWSFQQIPNIQRDFLSLSEFASQQCPIQCWIYLSTWHF